MTLTSPSKHTIANPSSSTNSAQSTTSSTTKPSQNLTTSTKTTTPSHLPSPSDTASSDASSSSSDSASEDSSTNSNDEEDEEDEDETAQPPSPPIPLRSRLAAFLPQLAAANESLLRAPPDSARDTGFEILEARDDNVTKPRSHKQDLRVHENNADEDDDEEDEEEEAGPYIEMDLDLGILEEKREKRRRRPIKDGIVLPIGEDDDASSEDESDEDDEEEEGQAVGGMVEGQHSAGILNKLKGETADVKRKRVVIEEVT